VVSLPNNVFFVVAADAALTVNADAATVSSVANIAAVVQLKQISFAYKASAKILHLGF